MNKWKVLKENDKYEININGTVRNRKTKKNKNYWETTTGYYTVNLLENNKKGKTYYIHRLVANNYIDNPSNYNEVNHINGNKKDNRIENLEWCNHQKNMSEAYRLNLIPKVYGKNHKRSKKIKQTNLITGEIKIWDSMMDAQREKGYSTGSICDACKGNLKTAYKSKWEYV